MDVLNICFIVISICNSLGLIYLAVAFNMYVKKNTKNKERYNFFVSWVLDELHLLRNKDDLKELPKKYFKCDSCIKYKLW